MGYGLVIWVTLPCIRQTGLYRCPFYVEYSLIIWVTLPCIIKAHRLSTHVIWSCNMGHSSLHKAGRFDSLGNWLFK